MLPHNDFGRIRKLRLGARRLFGGDNARVLKDFGCGLLVRLLIVSGHNSRQMARSSIAYAAPKLLDELLEEKTVTRPWRAFEGASEGR